MRRNLLLLAATGALLAQPDPGVRKQALSGPVTESNYPSLMQTVRDWGDDLTRRGTFLTQQDLNLTFGRFPGYSLDAERNLRAWVKVLEFVEANGGKLGSLTRIDQSKLIAGRPGTVVLEYITGDIPIQTGGSLILGQNFFNNRPRPQVTDPTGDSFVSFETNSRTAAIETYAAPMFGMYSSIFLQQPMPAFRVTKGQLSKGDRVTIRVGDRRRGSPGYRPDGATPRHSN
ncbi:MAG: hypothetical protein FJW39_20855 [Acidobacteria bacterium]|nr:hypothetical protein [Acidobacteriota bacterium]